MNYKGISAGLILTGAVVTPIALTVSTSSSAYEENPYSVTLAVSMPFKTLNKFKSSLTSDTDRILGTFTSALLKNRPVGKAGAGLETALSVQKLAFGFEELSPENKKILARRSRGWQTTLSNMSKKVIPVDGPYGYEGYTGDLASLVMPLGSPTDTQGVIFKLRKNARYWNGDQVCAEDFLETIRVALDAKNGVPWAWQIYRTMGLYNAKKIWDAQVNDGLTIDEAMAKYPLGVIPSDVIPLEEMSTTPEGRSYYEREYAEGRKRHSTLTYLFEGNVGLTFMGSYALNTVSTPTNIRHFEQVGIDEWGTSVDNLMGCGAFKIKYFDLDYKIVTERWDGYWDRQRVISPQIEMRVLPDIATEIQMFKDGKIGTVTFGASMLPQFFSDPELKKYIKPTNYSEKLIYLGFNTTLKNPNAKWLLQEDFRRALSYSVDRNNYLSVIGADNTFPTESWTTLAYMSDGTGQGTINYSMSFNNEQAFLDTSVLHPRTRVDEWNKLYGTDGTDPIHAEPNSSDTMFTRDESLLSSQEQGKNDKSDKIHNPRLARAYYERFKKNNPSFKGLELKWMVPGSDKDNATVIKQDIEQTLPGITIKVVPKPELVYKQVLAEMDWDISLDSWAFEYRDPWALYHLVGDKVSQSNDSDVIVRRRMNKNIASDGMSLVDYIAMKLNKDPAYFAKRFLNNGDANHVRIMNGILAQYLRLEATVGSENPNLNQWQSPINSSETIEGYDERIWDTAPAASNDFAGYKGTFDKYEKIYKGASTWGANLKQFIKDNSDADLWKNESYKFKILYPVVEKIIRDSALGIPVSRLRNAFLASRFVGEMNYADQLNYLGYIYQVSHIPPSTFSLPGKEALQ